MKIAVYTSITGDYEPIRHKQNTLGAKYFLFSDKYEWSPVWSTLKSTELFEDPRRNARFHKILPHLYFPNYDVWIWIDGSIEVIASPEYLVRNWLKGYDMVVLKHPDRNCIYKEAEVVKGKGYDYGGLIDSQMAKYRSGGYPAKNGLSETKIVMRYNTPEVVKFNKMWFYELATGSLRDQLSFDYCVWKTELKINRVTPFPKGQDALKYYKHEKARKKTRYER
jgi:hypothetical protein